MTGHDETPKVGLVVDVTVTVINTDTSESVTISASSDPTLEATVADLLDDELGSITRALVERVTGSVCAQADVMVGGA